MGASAYRNEDLYDAFYGKQNSNYKPVVHMSDGIEDSYLHFAQQYPNTDPYTKQEIFDPSQKVKDAKGQQHHDQEVDVTYVFDPKKQHEQPMTKVEELIHQLSQPEHHFSSNDKPMKPVFPWEDSKHTATKPVITEESHHEPDFAYWTAPSQPRDYKLYEAMHSQTPAYQPHSTFTAPTPITFEEYQRRK